MVNPISDSNNQQTVIEVTTEVDENNGLLGGVGVSLREAIAEAATTVPPKTITFNSRLSGKKIVLNNTGLVIDSVLTIDASALDEGITIDGNRQPSVFLIAPGANVTLNSLTVTGGISSGGIANQGTLTLRNSIISGNFGNFGGGIQNQGTLTVSNSTFSGNTAKFGGAIYGSLNTTISGNSARNGGGIYFTGSLTLKNTILADNTATVGADISKVSGTVTKSGNNLIGDNSSVEAEFPAGTPNPKGDYVGTSGNRLDPKLVPLNDIGALSGRPVAGLWIGEVIVDAVTSIVEDRSPTRPAAGSAPIRILVHSDHDGAVRLLSQVTIMQTKTVDPVPVLVVDQARIRDFEGIKDRNGKRVGLRLEAVAFDMPRKLDVTSQEALAAKTSAQVPPVTLENEVDVLDYLVGSSKRPAKLDEDYHLTLALEGALGAGKTVKTKPATLTLDPFHRSNPFRHAFHQSHPKGPKIIRELTIVFGPNQAIADRLCGSYCEAIQGLTESKLKLTGSVELRRVSAVDTLDDVNPDAAP